MELKEFLKPTIRKIILMVVFTSVSLLSTQFPDCPVEFCNTFRGFPIPSLVINFVGEVVNGLSVLYFGLLVDLIFWYLISCLIVFIYKKFRKIK